MTGSKKITLEGYIEVRAADLGAVTDALPEHIDQTRNEAGCEFFFGDTELREHKPVRRLRDFHRSLRI